MEVTTDMKLKIFLIYFTILMASSIISAADAPVAPNGISIYSDYMSWKVIAPSYRDDRGHIRIVTGNDTAVDALLAGRKPLPDGSVLAKVAWKALPHQAFPVATVPGSFIQVEFMVKDSRKYKSTGGWGFARFVGNELKPYGKDAGFVGECYGCHVPVADNDYLFTRIVKTPKLSSEDRRNSIMYTAKDYSNLIGMSGFSEALLKNHITLYQGYVTNTNRLLKLLELLLKEDKEGTPEFAEIKRRLGWEFNGMRLHEYYFDTLGGDGVVGANSRLAQKKIKDFGSIEMWAKDFRGTGAMRGIGWVVMYQDIVSGRLFNVWINEHDSGHPAGCIPILVMDVFEHAFMLDYGLKRADYMDAFFKNINWKAVEDRLK